MFFSGRFSKSCAHVLFCGVALSCAQMVQASQGNREPLLAHYALYPEGRVAMGGGTATPEKEKERQRPSRSKSRVFFTGDYLLWRAGEDQLVYAVKLEEVPSTWGIPKTMHVKEQHFDWDSGFKLGIGYRNHETWELALEWTRFHTHSTSHAHSEGLFLIATGLEGCLDLDNSLVLAEKAKSAWHLHFDTLDLMLGRCLKFGRAFSLKPSVGLKGGWIDQKQRLTYQNISSEFADDVVDDVVTLDEGKVTRKNNYAAIGPSVTLHGRWGRELAVFGDLGAALLYGHFNVSSKYEFVNSTLTNGKLHENKQRVRPMLQAALGLDWMHWFHQSWGLSLSAAYEVQYWWNQWQGVSNVDSLIFSGAPSTSGDLMFQGLTAKLGLFF